MRLKKFCLVLTATIGCRASEKTLMPENEVNAALSVSAPTTVRLNDGLMFEVSFTNLGTSPIVMEGGWKHISTDFLREDTQKQVYSIPGPVQTLEYNPYTVPPGGTFRERRWWDLRNGNSDPVPVGAYTIRASAFIRGHPEVRVESSLVRFVITR